MSAGGRTRVLLWGPFPRDHGRPAANVGGYVRYNSLLLHSTLASTVELVPHPVTIPAQGPAWARPVVLVGRLVVDAVGTVYGIVRWRPQVVHITAQYLRSIYREAWATLIARMSGAAVLFDVRAGEFEAFAGRSGPVPRRLLAFIMRRASAITVEGRRYQPFIEANWGRRSAWVPNFVLEEHLARHAPAELVPPAEGEPIRLCYVGLLSPDKGVDVMLDAARLISKERAVTATLIGPVEPRLRPTLAAHEAWQDARYRVIVAGTMGLDQLLATLRTQHLFVFLSRHAGEGHSNAVNEAMAMGLPVIASRQGFMEDVVTGECGGLVDDARDPAEAAAAIRGLVGDWAALVRRGKAARRRMETVFNGATVLRTIAGLYEELGGRAVDSR